MATDYDQQDAANRYRNIAPLPIRRHPERDGLLGAVGDVRGQRVIDVACGDGLYAREWRRAGAREVVGVDLSVDMIERGRCKESHEPLGIAYHVGDARNLRELAEREDLGIFDVATAAWLLVYAETRGDLRAMCRSLASIVRPGGRFVHVARAQSFSARHAERYATYGLSCEVREKTTEYVRCRVVFEADRESLRLENTDWSRQVLASALEEAEFTDVRFEPVPISTDAIAAMGEAYWADYVAHPILEVLSATRADA
ncbi:MAG: class I SAM-dependent methyltransferase [Myxococcota bacterium]